MASDPLAKEIGLHVGWLVVAAAALLCAGRALGALGPAVLALLFLPNLMGIQMLLSWQWAVAVLLAELADVQAAQPTIAAFGFCIVGCPYYALNVHMNLFMGIDLPDRVKFGWARWITSNLYDFTDESKTIVTDVLRRGSVTPLYKLVFLQFDLLCHLLPMVISLQKHAHRIQPTSILAMAGVFFAWGGLTHLRHFQLVRIYETLRTWRLCLVPAPQGLSLREHMQLTYLTEPALNMREQRIVVVVGFFATGLLLYLSTTGQHSIIELWLAWGRVLPVPVLLTIYCVVIATAILSTIVSWFQIFFKETRAQEKCR